ncbi:RBBP9/YdeN family alpha/beta hydrolase [Acinetobacter rathckeae]|uniref:RBBP9/YdeN family alpha/beta hydrolase n=1 Tax=Acinetobacter rathckeae TaxID=2605272 RepID=UPI0018A26029|nr:alpha/beta hydrolase [Acinetobacter rathckeae]MBF7687200.1 alpha/beta hydrolase [Acinetobacter rathckeae]MBF7694447.1 alpha/beta hydrolase [Acinetobacter rathckeae]
MTQLCNIIVPGVGGSGEEHWQTWLEQRLPNTQRVMQQWHEPILEQWVQQWLKTIATTKGQKLQIIAHSFGCLTSIAALAKHPHLQARIEKLILVAPANPIRFSQQGFATQGHDHFLEYFKSLHINVPTVMFISENDPWLNFEDAKYFAKQWQVPYVNLGKVGHINIESGFGAFPQLLPHLVAMQKQNIRDYAHYALVGSHKNHVLVQSI